MSTTTEGAVPVSISDERQLGTRGVYDSSSWLGRRVLPSPENKVVTWAKR